MNDLIKKYEDKKVKVYLENILLLVLSLFTTLSIFMGKELEIEFSNKIAITVIYIVCFLLGKFLIKNVNYIKGSTILSILLTYFKYCELIIDSNGYLHLMQTFNEKTKLSVIAIIGIFTLYEMIIHILYYGIKRIRENRNVSKSNKVMEYIFDKNTFLTIIVIILLFWLPHIIIQFPAAMAWDSDAEIAKFMGVDGEYFSSHYPPVHIWLLGKIITRSKEIFNNTNPGFFLLTCINVIIGSIVFANSFITMKKMKIPYYIRGIILLMYSILPIFVENIIVIVKDNLFGLGMLLLVNVLVEYIIDKKGFWNNYRNKVMIFCSIILIMLTRNNGIHIIILTIIAWIIKMLFEKKLTVKKIALIIAPVILAEIIIQIVTIVYNVVPGNPREKYSFFFQQTALYIKYNEKDISEWEKEILNKTLEYDKVAELYDPNIVDPVKDTYKSFTMDYIKVYLYEFVKHPMTYIEATSNLIYSIFVPDVEKIEYYPTYESTFYKNKMEEEQIKELEPMRENLINYYKKTTKLPIINILSNYGTYTVILMIILVFLFNDKRYEEIFILIPLILTILFLIISPVACMRYCYPIIFSVPLLLLMSAFVHEM